MCKEIHLTTCHLVSSMLCFTEKNHTHTAVDHHGSVIRHVKFILTSREKLLGLEFVNRRTLFDPQNAGR